MYEKEIGILEKQLEMDMGSTLRTKKLNLLRYYLGEEEEEKDKVKYNKETDKLEYSKSIKIAMAIVKNIDRVIKEEKDIKEQQALLDIMYENYYYLARYLYYYYAIAIEFGIEKEKQFLAPRRCVLDYINWKLTKFYYKDRGIMTISMPQGTRKDRRSGKDLCHFV